LQYFAAITGFLKYLLFLLLDASGYLPLQVRYKLTDITFTVAYFISLNKRKNVGKNLQLILDRKPNPHEVMLVFRDYGRYWAELPRVNELHKTLKIIREGDFPLSSRSFLGVSFHIGNFELFGPEIYRMHGCEFNVIAEHLRPQIFANHFIKVRKRHHIRTIFHDDFRTILNVLKSGEPLGILCDRIVAGYGIKAHLFGRPVRLPVSVVKYALDAKIPIYISYTVRKNQSLVIQGRKIDTELSFDETVKCITDVIENAVRLYPYQWHMLSSL
jgi:lauroyl/myristoyl acyltransferase